MKKLLVIDGNSIINRAFYGVRAPLSTKDGMPTGAIFGMLNIVLRQLETIKPDYAAVAFDLKAPNFRKQRFPYYKEGRHETPPELLMQFDDAKECLRLLGFHTLELAGYEADDILGTLAAMAEAEGDTHTYVLSGDRDLLQLISDQTTVLLATTGETVPFDRDAFFGKYSIEPHEFVELKALMGDSSDRIPGVPGIGEKTAVKLISEFHSIRSLYEQLDAATLSKGVKEKLANGRQSAEDSLWLSTICRQVPLGIPLCELAYGGICPGMYDKCMALEFTQLIRKLGLRPEASSPCHCVCPSLPTAQADADMLLSRFPEGSTFAFSSFDGGYAFADGCGTLLFRGTLSSLADLFDGSRHIVAYDGKALLHLLWQEGIEAEPIVRDLMLYAYVLDSTQGGSRPETLSRHYLQETPDEEGPEAATLFRLLEPMEKAIDERGCRALLEEVELPLSLVLARMERHGFRIDTDALAAFGKSLENEITLLTENITALAEGEFNINSPKQLAEVLFERLMLPTKGLKKNKNGYSTDAETLNGLRGTHPIIDEILLYRQYTKLYSTYVQGLLKAADESGVLHTDFKQALTATGRLSSAEPNLQNIPIRTALGRELRRVFRPRKEGYVLVDADYSQIELRLLAAFSGDGSMCDAFRTGTDIHRRTAAAVFRVPESAVPDELRSRAKAVNFGIVYGISAYSLSGDIGVSVAEAKRYMDSYFAEFPGIRAYLDRTVEEAEANGYTETCLGRRRYIPELSSRIFAQRAFGKRVAMNSPIQGSAADIIKLAMVRVDRRLRSEGLDARLVMQVHDELIVECANACADRVRTVLVEEMENAHSVGVPLTVSTAMGSNWLEAAH